MSCGPPADLKVESLQQPSYFQMDPDRHGYFHVFSLNLSQKIILPALLNTKIIHPQATNDQNRPNVDPDDGVDTRGKEEPPTGTEGG